MSCPASYRKVNRDHAMPGVRPHVDNDGVWHVQDYATAQAILRSTNTRQAGFGIDTHRLSPGMRRPVLWRDGVEHRDHRRRTARLFTPRRVQEAYLQRMNGYAGQICERLRRAGRADLSKLSFDMAVAVAADIVGLPVTGGLARRLDRFFAYTGFATRAGWPSPVAVWRLAAEAATLAAFYLADVRPAVRSRRRQRREDLISHLVTEGATAVDILGECVIYAAAGMVTTREFITVAAWHLLTDAGLRQQYQRGDRDERTAVLHEILRLEPVVSNLARWTTADHELPGRGDLSGDHGPLVVPAGARVSISVAAANLDPRAIGADADRVCPRRTLADGVAATGLAFGDGAHRCPGMHVALRESEIFLSALLALPGVRLEVAPAQAVLTEISSYQLSGAIVAVESEGTHG